MMGKWFILILSVNCFNFVMNTSISEIMFPKSLKIDQFLGRCPGHNRLPLSLQDIHFTVLKNNSINLSTNIIATRDLLPHLKLVIKLDRCKAKEDLDSCEPYQDVNRNNMCELQKAINQPWTAFFSQTNPVLPCPLKKGTYRVHNSTIDTAPLIALPIQGWYWKVKAILYETVSSTMVMCIYVTGYVLE